MKNLFLYIYIVLAFVAQAYMGNFPLSVMAFPLNLLLAAVWVTLMVWLYKKMSTSALTRFLLSPGATIHSLVIMVGMALIIGLFPQLSPSEAASQETFLARLGCYDFVTSWPFLAALFLLQTVLGMCILRGWRHKKQFRPRFFFVHVGLWLALFGGFWGAADTEILRMPVYREAPSNEAFREDGRPTFLAYDLQLHDFQVEYYANGVPSRYAATLSTPTKTFTLEVNHPHSIRWGEDIYLTSYDVQKGAQSPYCIVQIVREPWKYVTAAGILLLLMGSVLIFFRKPQQSRK